MDELGKEFSKKSIFINILYTLVLTISLSNFCTNFFNQQKILSVSNLLLNKGFILFIIALLTISFSWFGYHRTIEKFPHDNGIAGMARFTTEVIILFANLLLLYNYSDIGNILFMLTIIYTLYVLWDVFTILEHGKKYFLSYLFKSIGATIIFAVLYFLYRNNLLTNLDYLIIIILFASIIGYRIIECFKLRKQPEENATSTQNAE